MKIVVDKEMRLSDLLMEEFQNSSRSAVKKILLHGGVTVNGKEEKIPSFMVKPGDEVEYTRFKAAREHLNSPFPVIYEDETLLLVEKPAGILTHAEKGTIGTSLYKEMLNFVRERSKGQERIYVVHRLDREVSGIVLFVKNEKIQEKVKDDWKSTKKKYYALVNGKPPQPEGRLENWLKESSDQRVFVVRKQEAAKLAISVYRTVREFPDMTLLEVQLETGRKNQIRVQLAEIGCPIIGDRKYGSAEIGKRRIRLHAYYFSLNHPVTGQVMEFKIRMPKGFLTPGPSDEKY